MENPLAEVVVYRRSLRDILAWRAAGLLPAFQTTSRVDRLTSRQSPTGDTAYDTPRLPMAPNARLHLLPEAAAQRRLEAVSCKALLGRAEKHKAWII